MNKIVNGEGKSRNKMKSVLNCKLCSEVGGLKYGCSDSPWSL